MKKNSKAIRKGVTTGVLAVAVGLVGVAGGVAGAGMSASAEVAKPLFTSSYSSKAEAMQAGLDLNLKIAEEGMVLLKNENNALRRLAHNGIRAQRYCARDGRQCQRRRRVGRYRGRERQHLRQSRASGIPHQSRRARSV